MKSSYKKLGQYIREVSVKNKDLTVTNLLGVSITKKFIPSIANTIGTDMSKYKIVQKNQFAYGSVTSRNGEKISVALLDDEDSLVSTAYTVFEIINIDELLPEYLMMWFRRPEFDRYARYMSHGSVREMFSWEEMCDTELPVPHIDKQREIVKEYHTIVDRIALNEELNHKLEETAQAIYRQWFVEFEFPVSKEYAEEIGKPELAGKPYKSSGGEMVFNEELEKDIPVGWRDGTIANTCEVINGRAYKEGEYREAGTPIIRIQNLNGGDKYLYSDMDLPEKKYVSDGALIFAWSATFGPFIWRGPKSIYHYHIWRLDCFEEEYKFFLYHYLLLETRRVSGEGSGSIFAHITKGLMEEQKLVKPEKTVLNSFHSAMKKIDQNVAVIIKETELLEKFKNSLLSKMTKVGA